MSSSTSSSGTTGSLGFPCRFRSTWVLPPRRRQRRPTKLSYKDQRELDLLPAELEDLEASIKDLQQQVSDPEFYTQDHELVQARLRELADAEALLEQRIERWSELESLQASLRSE